jgi:hypothetical protein
MALAQRLWAKLVTREDARFLHLHKAMGFLALGHFAYRIGHGFVHGHLGFGPDAITLAWVALHAALSLSSLEFHLPSNRVRGSPMIWPEARMHSIVFTLRSVAIMLLYLAAWRHYEPWMEHGRTLAVLATMAAADSVSARMATAVGGTTMRDMPYPAGTSDVVRCRMQLFYATSQALSTVTMFMGGRIDAPFLALLPIQSAVFLMTLVRKGFISATTWHIWYSAAILVPYGYTLYRVVFFSDAHCFPLGGAEFAAQLGAVALFYVLRLRLGVGKYAVWALIIAAKTMAWARYDNAFVMGPVVSNIGGDTVCVVSFS